ncbi:hypothetical protein [Streptomyces sp. NPDC058308]|uniref:hypothetical protein n=1 Tax=Streptomyces sp. NPDC058308 TaxID=3346440 RepID=UPI0036E51DBC
MHRVKLRDRAAAVMDVLPDDGHEEVLAVIDAVAEAPEARSNRAVAFGVSSWVTCSVAGDVVEVLDNGRAARPDGVWA